MTAKLTPEQVQELERSGGPPLLVEDPQNHRGYVLVPSEAYEQARPLFEAIIASTRGSLGDPGRASPSVVEWNDQKNARRCWLIDKKHGEGLTPVETSELEALQAELAIYQRQVAPRPVAILELIEEGLRHRAASTRREE
jgi:hypothetical protein